MQEVPTTVVFDVGNVLIRWKPEEFYLSVIEDPVRLRWYMDNVHTVEWNLVLDRGLMSWDQCFDERIAAFPEWEKPLRAYQTGWPDTIREPIEPNVALLHKLKAARVPTYAITNFSGETFRLAQKRQHDFLNLFDGVIVSGEENMVKPDPAIYQLLCSRYGLMPGRCVFIDDNAANVAAARAEGMHGICFAEPMDLAAELRGLGIAHI